MKKQRGITLIALVVTIIVLLILAMISINLSIGNHGVVKQSVKAKEEVERTEEAEKIKRKVSSAKMNNTRTINYEELKSSIKQSYGDDATVDIVYNSETKKEGYVVKLPDGTVYPVETDKDAIDVFVPEADTVSDYDIRVVGYKIALKNGVRLRIYLTIPEEKLTAGTERIQLKIGSKSATYVNQDKFIKEIINDEEYYYVEQPVYLKQMADNINICAYNGSTKNSKEYNYSIKQCGNYILNNKELYGGDKNPELMELIKALLNMGGKVQVVFSYNTSNLADENIEIDDSYITKEYLSKYDYSSSNMTNGYFEGGTLVLQSNIILKLYFLKKSNDNISNYHVYVDNKEQNLTTSSTEFVARLDNFLLNELDKKIFFEVKDDSNNVISSGNFGILTYAHHAVSGETASEATKSYVRSLALFHDVYQQYLERYGQL